MKDDASVIVNPRSREIVLTNQEFEYVQWMLDFGATLEQVLQEIHPELSGHWRVVDCVLG